MKKYCKYCGKEMKVIRPTQIFCSNNCCTKWHQHYNPKMIKYCKEYRKRPEVMEKVRIRAQKWSRKFREENGYWYIDQWKNEHAGEKLKKKCEELGFSPATTNAMVLDGVLLDKRLKELKKGVIE